MIRYLAPLPAEFSLAQLREDAEQRFPDLIDFNEVDDDNGPNAAIYLPLDEGSDEPPEVAAWRAAVVASVPQHPTPEEVQAAAQQAAVDAINALTGAQARNAAFLALASPTTAQRNAQAVAETVQLQGILTLLGVG